jgi:hypothetical protein
VMITAAFQRERATCLHLAWAGAGHGRRPNPLPSHPPSPFLRKLLHAGLVSASRGRAKHVINHGALVVVFVVVWCVAEHMHQRREGGRDGGRDGGRAGTQALIRRKLFFVYMYAHAPAHTVDDDLEAPPSPSNANATDRSGGNEKGGGLLQQSSLEATTLSPAGGNMGQSATISFWHIR